MYSGALSQAKYDQMMEKKREEHIAKPPIPTPMCRNCGYWKSHHTKGMTHDSAGNEVEALFCFESGNFIHQFDPIRPTDDDHPSRRHTIPSVTAGTSQKLISISSPGGPGHAWVKKSIEERVNRPPSPALELGTEIHQIINESANLHANQVDPICRLCRQRKSIHHTATANHIESDNSLYCFKLSPQKFETLRPLAKDLRLEMEVVTRDKLASQLAQERGLVKSSDPVSIPNLDPEKMREEEPAISAGPQGVYEDTFTPSGEKIKQTPAILTTSGKQAQIVTAIGLAKMVDDLKAENITLRHTKAEVVDKYVECRFREDELKREGETIFQRGRRSMDKWVVIAYVVGMIITAICYATLY